jgi:hypothetical protein
MAIYDEHKERVKQFPEAVREAHNHCSSHLAEINASDLCGCFYCCSVFPPSEIVDWCDADVFEIGQTALCPRCGVDAVIGSSSGIPITLQFLQTMRSYWF